MDTFNRMNYDRMRGVLMAIRDFKDLLGDNEGITDYFRECKKHLNHYAAVTTFEFLDSDEISDYMVKLREEKLSGTGGSLRKRVRRVSATGWINHRKVYRENYTQGLTQNQNTQFLHQSIKRAD